MSTSTTDNLQRHTLHGAAVGLTCFVDALRAEVEHLLGEFRVAQWGLGAVPVSGTLWPYEQSHVLKHLSQSARRMMCHSAAAGMELYEEGERFWLVDDRWGIAEMNLLKGQWRSWILPACSIDPVRCAALAMLWPMAQVLRARGVYLAPAASVALGNRAFLMLAPFGIERELSALIRGGYRVIGQSWTALREECGRFSMLRLPGYVERSTAPGMRLIGDVPREWVDLTQENIGAEQGQGWCDAVLIVDPARRPRANVRLLDRGRAVQTLRSAWPIFELHPNRRHGQLPARLAQGTPCYELQLSREPRDLLKILATLPTPATEAVADSIRVAV